MAMVMGMVMTINLLTILTEKPKRRKRYNLPESLPDQVLASKLFLFRSSQRKDAKININFQILKSGFYAFLVGIRTNQCNSLVL